MNNGCELEGGSGSGIGLETMDHGPWSISTYFNHCLVFMGKIQQKERLQKGVK